MRCRYAIFDPRWQTPREESLQAIFTTVLSRRTDAVVASPF
jgi:hypothetical protein